MIAKLASGAPRLMSPARATALILAVSVAAPQAQMLTTTVRNSEAAAAGGAVNTEPPVHELELLVGRSAVVNIGQTITRVSLSAPTIADAMVTSPQQLLVHGKAPGSISMFVWDKTGGIRRYEVNVQRDLTVLQHQMKTLFPGEPIAVYGNGKDVVISGVVTSKYVVDKAADVAAGYVEKKEDVVNLLKQQEGVATEQVLLRVRFAEVSRSALSELGSSFAANGFKQGRWYGRTTTQQFAAPEWDQDGKFVFSDFLNLFLFDTKNQLAGVIRALSNKGLFQSLAEPNLIAENGKEASFLAGGEYPYPVVQGQSGGTTVTIQFKEFGIKLNFTPVIVGTDLVKLKVRPEVSSLDFANALTLQGFRVPAISTRRTETEVELQDGQTFAIAGLMNNTVTSQMSKIPGIGDVPILGLLFRSKAAQKNQTELVVMITPQILRRGSTGVSPKLPNLIEPYMPPASKVHPAPAPWDPAGEPQAEAAPAATPAAPAATAPEPPARAEAAPVQAAPEAPAPMPQAEPAAQAQPASAQSEVPAATASAAPQNDSPEASDSNAMSTADQAPQPTVDKAAEERARKQARADAEASARRMEAEKKQAERLAKEQAKEQARQAEIARKQHEKDRKQAEKDAKEQARIQAELQKRQDEAARQQAAADKKKAERDREQAEELAKAQLKLKQAQEDYQAALDGRAPRQ